MPDPDNALLSSSLKTLRKDLDSCRDSGNTKLPDVTNRAEAIRACEDRAFGKAEVSLGSEMSSLQRLKDLAVRRTDLAEKNYEAVEELKDDYKELFETTRERAADHLCVIVALQDQIATLEGKPKEAGPVHDHVRRDCVGRLENIVSKAREKAKAK